MYKQWYAQCAVGMFCRDFTIATTEQIFKICFFMFFPWMSCLKRFKGVTLAFSFVI